METEMIDRLFLELSQVTKAKTKREIALESAIIEAIKYAGNRESEWGERAEASFEILRKAIEQTRV